MKPSPQKAINAKCKECIYDESPGNGTLHEQIEGCTSPSCPLFDLRPVTSKTRQERDEKYLASLSVEEKIIVENRRAKASERMLELRAKAEAGEAL